MTNEGTKAKLEEATTLLLSAFPEDRRLFIRENMYFAGGCVVDLVRGETPRDYDVFFKTEEAAKEAKIMAIGLEMDFKVDIYVKARTENAITLEFLGHPVFQLVTRFFGDTERVFRSFDFTHCKSYYDPHTKELVYDEYIVHNKILHYDGIKDEYTLNTLKRLCKFVSRGWTPDNTTIVNLYKAIQKRPPLEEPGEHRAQSVGFYGSSFN